MWYTRFLNQLVEPFLSVRRQQARGPPNQWFCAKKALEVAMRKFFTILGSVLLVLSLALPAGAATLQSFARVNLVQGAEVLAVTAPENPAAELLPDLLQQSETMAQPPADHQLRFVVSGPAQRQVSLQLAALEPQAQWWDPTGAPGGQVAARHDADGLLLIGLGPDDGTAAHLPVPPESGSAARLVLSVIYE